MNTEDTMSTETWTFTEAFVDGAGRTFVYVDKGDGTPARVMWLWAAEGNAERAGVRVKYAAK